MKIGIGNINALSIGNRIDQTSRALARSLERLASGRGVLSPSDNASAYSLGVRLDSQLRGVAAANQNINEGIGLVNTATAALDQLQDIVLEMQEIARVGSDSNLTESERSALQSSLTSLFTEFNRIRSETEYGDFNLLNGSAGTLSFQVGAGATDVFDLNLSEAQGVVAGGSTDILTTFGLGTFTSVTTSSIAGSDSYVTEAGDVDGDGDIDYITYDPDNTLMTIELNDGSGNFSVASTIDYSVTSVVPEQMELADFNRDGNLDLIVASGSAAQVRLGDGAGNFTTVNNLSEGGVFTLEDVNDDDNLDIIFQESTADEVYVFLGNGNATFDVAQSIALPNLHDRSVQLADFDNDGDLDMFVTSSTALRILENNGLGNFVETQSFTALQQDMHIAIGDFNEDGFIDFVSEDSLATLSSINFYSGNGDGSFNLEGSINSLANIQLERLEVGDFNNDGNLDVMGFDAGIGGQVILGNGDGTFNPSDTFTDSEAGLSFEGTEIDQIQIVDIDGDGDDDIVAGGFFNSGLGQDYGYAIYLNDGNGTYNLDNTYQTETVSGNARIRSSSLDVVDVDGDGELDLFGTLYDAFDDVSVGYRAILNQDTDTSTETFNYSVSVMNEYSAANLDSVLDTVLTDIQSQRADVAAVHSRLSVSLDHNLLVAEDLSQARENAIGVDLVEEVLESVTLQLQIDAQGAALAQSNLNVSSVLSLLDSL